MQSAGCKTAAAGGRQDGHRGRRWLIEVDGHGGGGGAGDVDTISGTGSF